MASIPVSQPTRVQQSPPLSKWLVAFAGGLVLFGLLLAAFVIGYQFSYMGRIFPSVSVAGIDLSGMTPDQASGLLSEQLAYPKTGRVVFQDGSDLWVTTPGEIGLQVDSGNSAQVAYDTGRQGNPFARLYDQFDAWYHGVNYPPILVYDEAAANRYLEKIASEVNQPMIEADLEVVGLDVVSSPGQVGRNLDTRATISTIEDQLRGMRDVIVTLKITENTPAIMDVSEQVGIARQILSQPLTIQISNPEEGDPGPWTFAPETLAEMMAFERLETEAGASYQIAMNVDELRNFLETQAPKLARNPRNARFIFNDETRELEVIQPAVIGRALDIEATIRNINQKLVTGEHNVPLEIAYIQPEVGDSATAVQLGISEPVSVYSSFFRGSSAARIQNIQTAAAEFHGLLIPPWGTFSMADNMREVSLDNGYAEALIIYGDRTIEGVGGGVCQVSTTLFRTVFFGGYPVLERHPHAYRVGYYEQTSKGWDADLAGLDATVFVPVVDFQFTNNTPYWLLMETYVNPSNGKLTWKFYSTSDGRSIEWETTGPRNTVEPPKPRYEENPDLAKGEIKQVDWEAEGADITVTRTVYKDGVVLFEDNFYTHYMPWQAVYQYGPGTKIPKDK